MMSPFDFENLVGLAEDWHAQMLAEAQQERLLKEAAEDQPQGHSVWQWLRDTVVHPLRHLHLHRPAGTRHATQHH